MSRSPAPSYRPRVEPATWRAGGQPLPGGLIRIPASRVTLFVSANYLRDLADQLHDLADQLEEQQP